MSGRALVDTSAIIDLFAERREILKAVEAIPRLAQQHDCTVLSCDDHFARVPGLSVKNPRLADLADRP